MIRKDLPDGGRVEWIPSPDERVARALERIADCLETLLESKERDYQDDHNADA